MAAPLYIGRTSRGTSSFDTTRVHWVANVALGAGGSARKPV